MNIVNVNVALPPDYTLVNPPADGLSYELVMWIKLKYTQNHPGKLSKFSMGQLIVQALRDAYPSPAPKGTKPAAKEY